MKITTKKGDKGETGLFDGKRVSKGANVIDVLGELDELQSFLGLCRNIKNADVELIEHLQDYVYRIMSIIGYQGKCPPSCKEIGREDVEFLEVSMDKYDVGDLKEFVRPGSDESNARFNVARSVCRRAERSVVKFHEAGGAIPEMILVYLNRLSDLLFVMGFKA
jgi:cob(I)alamin adenosyltransferase